MKTLPTDCVLWVVLGYWNGVHVIYRIHGRDHHDVAMC